MPWQWVKKKPKPTPRDTRCMARARFLHYSTLITMGITEDYRRCTRLAEHEGAHVTSAPDGRAFYFSDAHG